MASRTYEAADVAARKIGPVRLAATGGLAAAIFYIFCWIGAQLPIGPATHMYLQLFTKADLNSGASLVEGGLWSLVFGVIAGSLIALIYNALPSLDRR